MRANKEKVISAVIMGLVLLAIGYGVVSVVNFTNSKDDSKDNIVNLNEMESGNVAIKTEESDGVVTDSDVVKTQIPSQPETAAAIDNEEPDIADAEVADVAGNAEAETSNNYTFSEESTLLWPVNGDIVLKYSMDSTILFKSLGVYKCNPAISIAANVGTNAVVAADGVVESITENEETGTTVDIAIGNGYVMTYGLVENLLVKEGAYVVANQPLGTVAEPTAYYKEEGANLYFKLSKDGEPVDPTTFFEE